MFLTKPKAVIFDWDNTLLDTWPKIVTSVNFTLKHMGMEEWPLDRVKLEIHQSMRDKFPVLFGNRWEEARDVFYRSYLDNKELKILDGAEELLVALKQKNIPAAIVSNKRSPILNSEVTQLGWNKYFVSVVGSTDTKKDKPDPEPVLLALKPTGIACGKHVWFVGDSVSDLQCAGNTNSTAILYGDNEAALKMFADARVIDHNEIISMLRGI